MKKKLLNASFTFLSLALGVIVGIMCINPVLNVSASDIAAEAYRVNANGRTYGTMEAVSKNPKAMPPELISCIGIDGVQGYCYKYDIDGEQPANPEEAVKYMAELDKQCAEAISRGEQYLRYIPLYESDGKTVIGKFGISIPYSAEAAM